MKYDPQTCHNREQPNSGLGIVADDDDDHKRRKTMQRPSIWLGHTAELLSNRAGIHGLEHQIFLTRFSTLGWPIPNRGTA